MPAEALRPPDPLDADLRRPAPEPEARRLAPPRAPGPRLDEPWPPEVVAGDPASGALVLCDHATNAVPPPYGDLGLPPGEFERHIAYDIGAAAMSRALARALRAPCVLTRFSRLVLDPNRGADDPTLVMRLSDGAVVPGNRRVDAAEVERRIARFYRPYDEAVSRAIEAGIAAGAPPVILSMHSFTPVWRGTPRPWHVGVLYDGDEPFSRALLEALGREPGLVVGDNEPYEGGLEGDTIDRHATRRGLPNALIEVRQDLIATDADAQAWGERLARLLAPLLAAHARPAPRAALHGVATP